MNPYATLVADHVRHLREGRNWPLGAFPAPTLPTVRADAPRVLIFSPHPDDECIIGGIALRLQREAGWRVVNVAVTQGSKLERQAARLTELRAACGYLGFELVTLGAAGLSQVTTTARDADPAGWHLKVAAIADVLRAHQPRAIIFPHALDWNGTHIGVHYLVMDALASLGANFSTALVETEFWGQNYHPNLLVEISAQQLTEMITALTFHAGEVRRNPYHLTMPAWMINNVRLGGETVGGQGKAPPDFAFGTVYRFREWKAGSVDELSPGPQVVTSGEPVASLFA